LAAGIFPAGTVENCHPGVLDDEKRYKDAGSSRKGIPFLHGTAPRVTGIPPASQSAGLPHLKAARSDGFALIDLIFTIGLVVLIASLSLPSLLLARQSAGSASAIGSMRAISSAQLSFALTCGSGFYAPSLLDLGTAPPGSTSAFISPSLGGAVQTIQGGYMIRMTASPFAPAPPSCNGLALGEAGRAFKAGADPVDPTVTRFFATNANGQIYEDTASLYAGMPEAGVPAAGHILR